MVDCSLAQSPVYAVAQCAGFLQMSGAVKLLFHKTPDTSYTNCDLCYTSVYHSTLSGWSDFIKMKDISTTQAHTF